LLNPFRRLRGSLERLRTNSPGSREISRSAGPQRLRIGLAPDRLLVAAYAGRLRPMLATAEAVAVKGGGLPTWRAAVDALPSAVAPHSSGKPQVTLVLSSHFARYALLPADPALRTEDEWLAYARHRMESVHGHAVADWELKVAETGRDGARLACGVDRALLEAANARVAEAGATLVSVQPYLMAAFNRVRARLGGRSCWLVVAEPGRLALALMRDGAWHSVRCRKADESWRRLLPELLARESAALALEQPCTDVVLMTPEALDENPAEDLRVRDLTLPRGAPQTHQCLAMVLS
jgi:hypothetical protein